MIPSVGGQLIGTPQASRLNDLKMLLCRYCDVGTLPESLSFWKNHAGKPHLQWDDGSHSQAATLQFNLSHTSSLLGEKPHV